MNSYKPTIGIEIHIELKTNSKVFSPSKNSYNDSPNTNINEIDLAYPGVLPTVNEEVVKKAIKASLALNMSINKKCTSIVKTIFIPIFQKAIK